MKARALILAGLLFVGLRITPADAHALDLTTARVSLRDAHAEVIIELDLLQLFSKTPTELATLPDSELDAALQDVKKLIQTQTVLSCDSHGLPVVVTGFPGRDDLRAMAATTAGSDKQHGPLVRIRLESPATLRQAETIGIRLPSAVGPGVVTFVQPTTHFVSTGQSVSFAVRTDQRAETRPSYSYLAWLVSGVCLTWVWLVHQRRRRSESR